MKIIKTNNNYKPWRLYSRYGLERMAETEDELIEIIFRDVERMREALNFIATIARVEKQGPHDTPRMEKCFAEIQQIAVKALV